MNEIKIKDMSRVKDDIELNFLNLHRLTDPSGQYYRIIDQNLNFGLKYNVKKKKFKINLFFNNKSIFDGYLENGYLNDGFLNYAENQKNGNQIIVILSEEIPIENPLIQYNN